MHQPPERAQRRPARQGRPKLVEGLALAVEPMVSRGSPGRTRLADDWTVVTDDGSLAAHFEHTFTLTPQRRLGAHRARRRSGQAGRARRPLRRPLSCRWPDDPGCWPASPLPRAVPVWARCRPTELRRQRGCSPVIGRAVARPGRSTSRLPDVARRGLLERIAANSGPTSRWYWCRTATPACTSRRWPPQRPVAAVVFVDAGLPSGRTRRRRPRRRRSARDARRTWPDEDGLLPPWTRWWPDGGRVDALFPDDRDPPAAVEAGAAPAAARPTSTPRCRRRRAGERPAGGVPRPSATPTPRSGPRPVGTGLAGRDAAGAAPAPAGRSRPGSRTCCAAAARRD